MKLQMLLFRESMQQFFGKRGISFLGVALVRKRSVQEMEESPKLSKFHIEFFDLLTDETCENSFAVRSAIEGLLKKLRSEESYQKYDSFKVYSDSVGCFSGNDMVYWLARLDRLTDFKCVAHHLSES